jgi:hypothetical protein
MSGTTARAQSCEALIHKHEGQAQLPDSSYSLFQRAGNGAVLYYVGAFHSDDPAHAQFTYIKKKWLENDPEVAFYEGPDRGIDSSDSGTIRRLGESGYVRYLALLKGIKTYTLEPPIDKLYAYLIANAPQEEVDLYMYTKEAMRLRTRKHESEEQLNADISKMMKAVVPMLHHDVMITSVAQLDLLWKKHFKNTVGWWTASEDWYSPDKTEAETGSFTNKLARLSSEYRDIYMVRLLEEHIKKGERIFAVVGRNHVPMQADALKCLILQQK